MKKIEKQKATLVFSLIVCVISLMGCIGLGYLASWYHGLIFSLVEVFITVAHVLTSDSHKVYL